MLLLDSSVLAGLVSLIPFSLQVGVSVPVHLHSDRYASVLIYLSNLIQPGCERSTLFLFRERNARQREDCNSVVRILSPFLYLPQVKIKYHLAQASQAHYFDTQIRVRSDTIHFFYYCTLSLIRDFGPQWHRIEANFGAHSTLLLTLMPLHRAVRPHPREQGLPPA